MTEKRKTIIRVNHGNQPYFLVARSVAQNEALSYEALGLLVYLLSKPDDWQVYPETLKRDGTGKSSVYRLIKELRKAGHIQRVVQRDDKKHITKFEYVVYEQPLPVGERDLFPTNQEIGLQETGKLEVGNPHNTEYREVQSTEEESARAPELPDHAPMVARTESVQPTPQPDGGALAYTLIEAYCDAWDIAVEKYRRNLHTTHAKAARQLADLGAKPDEVKAMIAEKREAGRQMDEYPLVFAARDYVAWKAKPKTTTVMVDEKTAWRAAQKARPNVQFDAALDMLLPAFKDEDDRRRYITEYLNMPYVPFVEEAAS